MKLVKTNKANLPVIEAPTMTSLEMVDYINADRKAKAKAEGMSFPCKKYRKLEHRSFMKKVPKVLGEAAEKFFAVDTFINGTGGEVERDIYRFPKREACLMAMSYSYELQAQVFDHMTELEGSKDINLMDLSGLTELTIRQMQDRVAQAEKFSFAEHGQKGSSLMTLRKKEKKAIKKAEQLVKDLIQFKLCDLGNFPDEGEPA
ncbi:Rha family transcriptional regulator [Xenorhabdus bovienii]|uniref:Rha family transcriptional regulator n=1 Tax=Xenorhabdus bovienii TaxID=40576 RepID=UPI0023B22D0E|nr:Rha family transcriptional regulator [Xenorhabdus bovienii]MDE9495746.1 Rha family transcriptional regulator [Xenorhabdus bovienii]MDE9504148.1 Rha family transcriptional regulator [Xenorhabdus bovienii]MDE9571046.1 Rha family transcriptional regulator [Xenorhabdus bovienii]